MEKLQRMQRDWKEHLEYNKALILFIDERFNEVLKAAKFTKIEYRGFLKILIISFSIPDDDREWHLHYQTLAKVWSLIPIDKSKTSYAIYNSSNSKTNYLFNLLETFNWKDYIEKT